MAPPSSNAERAAYAEKMAYYLNKVNPVPSLPDYTGPYKVGTVDVEIAVADLQAPSDAPAHAADIHTILFRIFYPAQPESKGKRITWLPAPQRSHVSAYTKFLGFGSVASEILSCVRPPSHMFCASTDVASHHPASFLDTFTTLPSPSIRMRPFSTPSIYPIDDGLLWYSPMASAAPETHIPT